ncbi:MAG: DUF3592 domain-containing protein [Thermoguttaceae bacterium]
MNAQSYTTTIGTMTRSNIEVHRGRKRTTFSPAINYTYRVAGKDYSSDRYRYFWSFATMWRANAERVVADLPVGTNVTVYYAPHDPSDSILHPGLDGSDLLAAMFMIALTDSMVLAWLRFARSLMGRQRRPMAGGDKIWDDGFQTRIRLAGSAWTAGHATMLSCTYVGMVLIPFVWSTNPPLTLALAAWGMILGTGIVMFLWKIVRLAGGRFDLVIDTTGRSIKLPGTFGRIEDVQIPWENVVGVEVQKVERRGGKGGRYYVYAPTFVVSDRGGTLRPEKLRELRDETRANDLAAWLRERLQISPPKTGEERRT